LEASTRKITLPELIIPERGSPDRASYMARFAMVQGGAGWQARG
jgi:hypothetical protein